MEMRLHSEEISQWIKESLTKKNKGDKAKYPIQLKKRRTKSKMAAQSRKINRRSA